ncbi:MAG: virulence protein E [Bacteroides sp.]|mgnify:FL=1|uniref:BT4734/BF3469 family protein n=1 Tax=Bacteroides TaxID=816 RepID=UPI0025C23A1A|nr:BT4734/BF3469 family protein [Bacteroides sp.]MBS6238558.1 virulence protein E [Bacteroides sp.]
MKEYIMSFFNAPITNKVPAGVCSVAGLHAYVSSDSCLKELTKRVRADMENDKVFRGKKQTLLPYVTPAGIFSYCREQCIMVPSGLFVIDIDHLASTEEAAMWRDCLFADEVLQPDLAFVSPGAKGVKLFVPYRLNLTDTLEQSFDKAVHTAWDYLEWKHGLKADTANADMSRACFLAYDEEAKCINHKS